MIKQYINCSFVIFSSWAVYASCQGDTLLPMIAAAALVLSLLARLPAPEKKFAAMGKMPLLMIIILSMSAGFFWRGVFPPPPDANSPFPALAAAFQTATILATLFIWLRPMSPRNVQYLAFFAWATAAASIDVPFYPQRLLVFSTFCVLATVFVIPQTLRKPKERERLFRFYRDFILYSVLLVALTVGLFFGIAKTIVAFDEAFMNLANDYLLPRSYTNFLRIGPTLQLTNPGRSALDKRPVLEVTMPGNNPGGYLKMQVFKTFHNGTWDEAETLPQTPLAGELDRALPKAGMMMFSTFEKIVPSVEGVTAVAGIGRFSKSRNGVLYSDNRQNTRILEFSLDDRNLPAQLSPQETTEYLDLPADIAGRLRSISAGIVANETDPAAKAKLIQDFFRRNFQYSLSVNFRADNEGLIKMIEERWPAYCSYFATAMTLLYRAEGIPARVATGFHTTEKIDQQQNKFLVRVYDAHAWTEALLSRTDARTGRTYLAWRRFDATPAAQRAAALRDSGINISKVLENLWLSGLRLGAYIENLDKEKVKQNLLLLMVAIMLYLNRRTIISGIAQWLANRKRRSTFPVQKNDRIHSLYRRYEDYLKNSWNETRQASETDTEVLARLKTRGESRRDTLSAMENFVQNYHAARFGGKPDSGLEGVLAHMEGAEKSSPKKRTSGYN